MSYTKGPWTASLNYDPSAPCDVYAANGQPVLTSLAYGDSQDNALLAAAAPDMQELLLSLSKATPSVNTGVVHVDDAFMAKVRAAIAKSEGRS